MFAVRGAWGSGKEIRGARRTQHRAFRPTHGKQTAYRATFIYERQCVEPVQDGVFAKTRPCGCGPPTAKRGLCRVTQCSIMIKRPVRDVTSCVGA